MDVRTAASPVDRFETEVFTQPRERGRVRDLTRPRRRIVMRLVSASSKSMQEYQFVDERIVSHVRLVVRWA